MSLAKRFLALAVALTVLAGMAACKSDSSGGKKTGNGTTSGKGIDAEGNEYTLPNYESFDMGGRTIVLTSWYDHSPKSSEAKPDPAKATEADIRKWEYLKVIEKKYNVKFEVNVIPFEQIAEKLATSALSGEPFTDILEIHSNQLMTAALLNQILPIDEYALPNSDILNKNIGTRKKGKIYGKEYIFTDAAELPWAGAYLGYNKNLVTSLGLESPEELLDSGKWTWEKFREMARKATKITNGKYEQYGLTGYPQDILMAFIASNDGYFVDDVNKKSGLDDPRTVEAINYVYDLYNTDKSAYVLSGDFGDKNRAILKEGTSLFFTAGYLDLASATDLPFEFGIIPYPQGPKNTSGATFMTDDPGFGFCIPKGVKDPGKVLQIYEEWNLWFQNDKAFRTETAYDFMQKYWKTRENIQMVNKISSTQGKTDYVNGVPNFPLANILWHTMMADLTPAAAVETYKQQATDAVNQLFENKK